MFLYHGTSETAARQVLREGLKPRAHTRIDNWKHTVSSNKDAVYLTDTYPAYFCANAVKGKDRWAIIEIDARLLDESLFQADEDVTEQVTRGKDNLPSHWDMKRRTIHYRGKTHLTPELYKESLRLMGTCSYRGIISPKAISRVVYFDPDKNMNMAMAVSDASISLINYAICSKKYKTILNWFLGKDITVSEFIGFTDEYVKAYMQDQLEAIEYTISGHKGVEIFINSQ